MRIGFDAKRAFMNASGLGNYSRSLIHSLVDLYPGHEYFAFTPALKILFEPSPEKLHIIQPASFLAKSIPALWRFSGIAGDIERNAIDIYHGLSNELPRGIRSSTAKIVTIHDLIFLRYPEWYPLLDRKIYEKKFHHACREADSIVAVSEQTRQDIIEFFGTPESKITVVYQSCGEQFYSETDASTLNEFRRRKKVPDPFILYVGTIEERKNLLTVVKAMTRIQGVSLVVIGRKKKYFETVRRFIRDNGLESRVFFPENVPAEELPYYYRLALALAYPSYYEGFGIPVIEALWSGTPVIAASTSALPEAAGPSSLYMQPDDAGQLADHIRNLLTDHALRERLIRNGFDYAQRFHPKITSAELMKLYHNFA